jgi:hypothetical protein
MKKLALAVVFCFVAVPAFAEEKMAKDAKTEAKGEMKDMKAEAKGGEAAGGMGFMPRKVTKEDKKGIEAMFKAREEAMMKGDMAAVAATTDFPVFMVTDDSKGMVVSDTWTQDKWMKTMEASMKNMPKDMKMQHSRKYEFLTDSLAIVHDTASTTMGGKKMSWKGAELVVLKDGKWLVKAEMEGGWGDMAKSQGNM